MHPIKDVQINFHMGKMSCTLPKDTLEVVLIVNLIEDKPKSLKTMWSSPVTPGLGQNTSGPEHHHAVPLGPARDTVAVCHTPFYQQVVAAT